MGRRVAVRVRPLMYVKTDMYAQILSECIVSVCLRVHVFVPLPNRKTDLGFIFVM